MVSWEDPRQAGWTDGGQEDGGSEQQDRPAQASSGPRAPGWAGKWTPTGSGHGALWPQGDSVFLPSVASTEVM